MVLRRYLRVLGCAAAALAVTTAASAREGTLAGNVVDEGGNPIAGAAVTITSPNSPSLKIDLKTDEAGQFSTPVESTSWTYTVRVERDGFSPSQTDYKIPSGTQGTIQMTMHPPIGGPPPPKVDPAVAAYNAGVELIQQGDKAGAEKKFQEAVAAKPDLTAAWKVLSQLAYERKDYATALTDGRKVLEQDPSEKDLYGILMDAAQKTGDPMAAEYKQKYYEANADNPEVNYNAGVESYNANDYNDAASKFQKAIALKPDMANAYFWLGMSNFNLKKYGPARGNFQKYLQLAPQGDQAAVAKQMLEALPAK
jgi:TolA-binding protein